MRIIKSFFIAFSMYSKIPMPQFQWKDEDMRYALCFFPWVGAVIGVLWYLWQWLCDRFTVGTLCYAAVGAAIPLLVTGGFHVDGFLDTCDALHSYQSRERKLEILKDSHIGAFAVIMLALYGLIFLGGFSEITECRALTVAGPQLLPDIAVQMINDHLHCVRLIPCRRLCLLFWHCFNRSLSCQCHFAIR